MKLDFIPGGPTLGLISKIGTDFSLNETLHTRMNIQFGLMGGFEIASQSRVGIEVGMEASYHLAIDYNLGILLEHSLALKTYVMFRY